jgi:hypothetical protein
MAVPRFYPGTPHRCASCLQALALCSTKPPGLAAFRQG